MKLATALVLKARPSTVIESALIDMESSHSSSGSARET